MSAAPNRRHAPRFGGGRRRHFDSIGTRGVTLTRLGREVSLKPMRKVDHMTDGHNRDRRALGVVALDLDGVLWLGDQPLPGAADAVAALRLAGLRPMFLTNNSSLTIASYVTKLGAMGVEAAAEEMATSAQSAAELLTDGLRPGATVLACAGPGVVEAVETKGFVVVDRGPCDAVVCGWTQSFDYDLLTRASSAVREGARFVATNMDATYPGPAGLVPGNGSLVAAVATAAGRTPEVAGKPEAATVAMVHRRVGDWLDPTTVAAARADGRHVGVMVGDRPSTDGALARALSWPFGLVRSDVSSTEHDSASAVPVAFAADRLADLVDEIISALTPQ